MPHHFGLAYKELFLPPVNRAMHVLDRSFFRKRIQLAAANIFDLKNHSRVRRECVHDVLDAPRMKPFLTVPWGYNQERSVLLFKPGVQAYVQFTHSKRMKWFLEENWMEMVPYNLDLTYDYWTYDEILTAILPEQLGSPVRSYQPVGQIGNLLLKPKFHPYRSIIAQVFLDKTPQLKSIVVKSLPKPGADPSLPRPPMEYLAGDTSTVVTLKEARCNLTFDFATTDYSQDLIFAHKSLLASLDETKKHIAIAEVDAGVGQFTFPAVQSHILVHANNPSRANHAALLANIPHTPPTACAPRASAFVHATNLPARDFISAAARTLLTHSRNPETNQVLWPRAHVNPKKPPPEPRVYTFPLVFSHFIIPYSAGGMKLLDAFWGVYAGLGINERTMPIIHVYAYHASRSPQVARKDFIEEVRAELGFPVEEEEVAVACVVIGTKNKSLHRVSFRLPRKVAMMSPKEKMAQEEKKRGEGRNKTNTSEIESADSGVGSERVESGKSA